jgi:catechol 2,3-dioxygenase-like lactoylglutathione lyase family enzyme
VGAGQRGARRIVVVAAALIGGRAAAEAPGARVTSVDEVVMTVADADRSVAFFRDVLGFAVEAEAEAASEAIEQLEGVFAARVRVVHLRLGDEHLGVMQFVAQRGRPIPAGQRSHDGGFQHVAIVVRDLDAAYQVLRSHHVRHVSTGPQTLPRSNPAAGGIRAFYFADPDDHTLELIWFPPGKGDPRWQRPDAPLFQGIDHTAIGVRDTDASLRLYRDRLGLTVAGTSDNSGTEQAHLNAVAGAHLRITGLRAAAGPGIELLEYLAPRDGRPAPADLRANDVLHWQTVVTVTDPAAARAAAVAAGARAITPAVVDYQGGVPFAGRAGALVRDADGHALLLSR